ncbi:MAG TPA: YebC/PmpR family DNA-binding transcriptional regulator [Bdellovibrionales bacterium]|nr:YebC/PmpR family DNA-binding transcriptional regulator [Pseudobdellovibrionaceae bacterium]HAG91059.1 YebC/PmpR family DNA-binding transcriptional regulator [Bdellovibrionales bacterium]|tara:strand:- start:1105 stop:1812 length:708 start_codon:yes stop_codon:yes gene_type:complete
MGKGWKAAGKLEAAQKKGALFTKLAREITVSAKLGGPDPEANSRLKMAVNAALKVSCPKDTIERAIKKGSGQLTDGNEIEEVTYEGYGPHGVGVIVECQTDNRNRTVAEIRNIFKSNGGNMGETGAVAWMFDRVSLIQGKHASPGDLEEEAIEAGANEVERDEEEGVVLFYGAPEDLDSIRTALIERGWDVSAAELSYKAKDQTQVSEEQKQEVFDLLSALEDNDDSHRIHATID